MWGAARGMLGGQLGFHYTDARKGVYVDKFGDPGGVLPRGGFYLPLALEIDKRAYRYVLLAWRAKSPVLGIAIHPAHLRGGGSFIRHLHVPVCTPNKPLCLALCDPLYIGEVEWESTKTPDGVDRMEG